MNIIRYTFWPLATRFPNPSSPCGPIPRTYFFKKEKKRPWLLPAPRGAARGGGHPEGRSGPGCGSCPGTPPTPPVGYLWGFCGGTECPHPPGVSTQQGEPTRSPLPCQEVARLVGPTLSSPAFHFECCHGTPGIERPDQCGWVHLCLERAGPLIAERPPPPKGIRVTRSRVQILKGQPRYMSHAPASHSPFVCWVNFLIVLTSAPCESAIDLHPAPFPGFD